MIYNLWKDYFSFNSQSPPATFAQAKQLSYDYIHIIGNWFLSREYEQEFLLALYLKENSPDGQIKQIYYEWLYLSNTLYGIVPEGIVRDRITFFVELNNTEELPRQFFCRYHKKIGRIGNVNIPKDLRYVSCLTEEDMSIENLFYEDCSLYFIDKNCLEECLPYIVNWSNIIVR